MRLIASCLSNAANLHNELSRVAPQASHQLRRACEIMWRLQHGISLKTAKGPFVLCPCQCSFKNSAMPRAHPSSLILEHSSSSSITDPSSFTWLPHPSSCHRRWPSITDPSSFTWLPHMASSSLHLFAQRRSETLHISGQYLDAGVNLRSMPAFFGAVLRAAGCDSPSSVCAACLLALVWRHSHPQHRKKQQSLGILLPRDPIIRTSAFEMQRSASK